ncbi:hypothetical protein [Natronosalvus amylolyticus]|uniref:hypothetical protein n=1 Tax=Natronosalvus amylolyticus TaxID=2961994 RepID=UPI0020C9A8CB|nr:hypothetical protein [Natronosalvus amylolyticus]
MSTELESEPAQKHGKGRIPFDAICTGCQQIDVRWARFEEVGLEAGVDLEAIEPGACTSFKHVCYQCGSATWWNPVRVLTGVIRSDQEEA